jgi:hypothetical protein
MRPESNPPRRRLVINPGGGFPLSNHQLMVDTMAFSELATGDVGPFDFGDDRAQSRRTTHEYRVTYTHPCPPPAGFTHDFESPSVTIIDVDEEPGPSTTALGSSSPIENNENVNTLVCARCLDPLVFGGSSMSEDERSRRRLWSLRCGHMLDGKCIAELTKPRPAPDLEPTGTEVAGIGLPNSRLQGQSSSTQSQDGMQSMLDDAVGKYPARFTNASDKARAFEQPRQSSRPTEVADDQTAFAGNNSIRSRLRPPNNSGNVDHISSPTSSAACAQLSQPSSQHSPATGNSSIVANAHHYPRRRARKAMEPVILERHEWRCPVTLCERSHLSLHVESRGWMMDETQGAIPIFA